MATVPATQVRIPAEAKEALIRDEPVMVVKHERPSFVLISAEAYALVSHLLERYRAGLPVPIEELLTEEDLQVFALESPPTPSGASRHLPLGGGRE
jgi:PHD/YefM family antitoxin component YafN of YafNO toxin-antitoxin module